MGLSEYDILTYKYFEVETYDPITATRATEFLPSPPPPPLTFCLHIDFQ